MNVREKDRQKNSCPSGGLGLAAAAIGVGVGAALYYFFSKRPENPDGEGSTTGWQCEQPHTFNTMHDNEDTDSYTTISENSTTDTSMNDTGSDDSDHSESDTSVDGNLERLSNFVDSDSEDEVSDLHYESDLDRMNATYDSTDELFRETGEDFLGLENIDLPTILADMDSESDTVDWDVTHSSAGVPDGGTSPSSSFMSLFSNLEAFVSPRRNRERISDRLTILREQAFRDRSWSLEECSICFDVILKDQEVTTLPCTHHFHSGCIAPWLQERQTCPNCRKAAE